MPLEKEAHDTCRKIERLLIDLENKLNRKIIKLGLSRDSVYGIIVFPFYEDEEKK